MHGRIKGMEWLIGATPDVTAGQKQQDVAIRANARPHFSISERDPACKIENDAFDNEGR